MSVCAGLVDRVLTSIRVVSDREYELDAATRASVREEVADLCRRFPIPGYPPTAAPAVDALGSLEGES